jgi:O-antigen/teichoic acid export membrane protein
MTAVGGAPPMPVAAAVPRTGSHPHAATAVRAAPATDIAPPVTPNLVRAHEVAGARAAGANAVETLVFRGLSTPLALALVVLQSRFLHPDGRGAFVLAVLTVTIFSRLLGQLGVAVTNRRQQSPDLRGLVLRAFGIAVLAGIVGTAAIAVWGGLTAGLGFRLAALAGLALVPNVIWQTVSGVLLGLGRIRLWNVLQLLPTVVTLVGMLILVVALHGGVGAALTAWVAANALTALVALAATRPLWLPPDVPPLDDPLTIAIARLAILMGAVQVVNLFSYRIELFVLDHYRGQTGVGVYSIAMQAVESIWLVAGALATSITAPALACDDHDAARLVGRTAVKGLLLTVAVAVPIAAAAPFVIPIVFGDDYKKAATSLALLLPGVVLYAPVSILVVYLSVRRGRPGLSLVVAVAGMVLTAAAAIVLVPRLGGSGAAVASSVGYAGGAILTWWFFARVARARLAQLA